MASPIARRTTNRYSIPLALAVVVGLSLLASGNPPRATAEIPCGKWHSDVICHSVTHTDFRYNASDFTMSPGGLKGYRWHVNGGFVQTCWTMRSDGYSRVRMAAQLWDGSNKNTAEKIIDSTWRIYCDAATAKVYNSTDVQSWLRVLDGARVHVTFASARTLTQGR
jgi:hypothetical protein